jgi:hypothetical protein
MPIGGERAAAPGRFQRYGKEVGWDFLTPARAIALGEGSEVCHVP